VVPGNLQSLFGQDDAVRRLATYSQPTPAIRPNKRGNNRLFAHVDIEVCQFHPELATARLLPRHVAADLSRE
jgi:hypothetical protein